MRHVILATGALMLAAGCGAERIVAPVAQPQKSALRECYNTKCAPPPMLVVDGRRIAFESADLNPHDIALVEIVKGDSAVARFGEAARKGVVVITSKRGKPR